MRTTPLWRSKLDRRLESHGWHCYCKYYFKH